MLLKSREKSFELVQFEALRGRIVFSEEQERLYKYVTAGFMGECSCDEMVESMAERVIQLRDLLLASGGRTCQVASLLVVAGKVRKRFLSICCGAMGFTLRSRLSYCL